jgi:hypothetical protein
LVLAGARITPEENAGWNRRFVDALEAMGWEIAEWYPIQGQIMTPLPWHEGWRFAYPSAIVRKRR